MLSTKRLKELFVLDVLLHSLVVVVLEILHFLKERWIE